MPNKKILKCKFKDKYIGKNCLKILCGLILILNQIVY